MEELISHGLSNTRIADITGRSPHTVSAIRNGKRDENAKKSREKWRREHGHEEAAVAEATQKQTLTDWNIGDELNKLSYQIGCLTAAITRLNDLL